MKTIRTLLIAPLLVGVAACGSESGEGSGADPGRSVRTEDSVTGVRWEVQSVTVDGKRHEAPGGAYLTFDADGRSGGHDGCNHIETATSLDDGTLTVEPKRTTMIACTDDIREWVKTFYGALDGRLDVEVSGDRLRLTNPDGDRVTLTARRPAPLEGTRWEVQTLLDGETATSLPDGLEEPPHLRFAEKGNAVRGDLGCNSFSGTARVETGEDGRDGEGRIDFGPLTTTEMACTGPGGEVEKSLRKVLDDHTVRYGIQDHTLRVVAGDGTGFTAVPPSGEQR
ncbi:META domain-containing protein [Streptomyces sp. JJ36]|uniref:META domain-containing protein n=1 Tax=Streptomyces sp. JJ36 TaxID=2736645 RepID=UPI001F42C63C|nr:META domain-containing protein [Streptomyces sp. JJ36]MCF6523600.1 META domain-containing protein [Streptomyces sp. JJ36]